MGFGYRMILVFSPCQSRKLHYHLIERLGEENIVILCEEDSYQWLEHSSRDVRVVR